MLTLFFFFVSSVSNSDLAIVLSKFLRGFHHHQDSLLRDIASLTISFFSLDFPDLQVPWSALPTHPRPLKRDDATLCVCVCRMQDGGMNFSRKSIPSASGFPAKRNMLHFAQSDSRYYGVHQESRSYRGWVRPNIYDLSRWNIRHPPCYKTIQY